MSHRIKQVWPGGEHEFALGIGEMRAIQAVCDAGPEAVARRFVSGDWRIDDMIAVIKYGLAGAGSMSADEAGKLVTRLISDHGYLKFKVVAYSIISAALTGPEDDPVGESQGAEAPQENGSSASSTVQEP